MPACPNCKANNKPKARKCRECGLSLVTEWGTTVHDAILKTIAEEPDWRFSTIRSMFYYLSDALGLIPATEQGYKKLDELIVKMRKEGEIDFGYFDVARGQSASFSGSFSHPVSRVRLGLDYLLGVYAGYTVPRWHRQSVMVEVWCEKKGLMKAFSHHLTGLGVQLRSPEGFSPWEFVNSVINEIDELMDSRGADELVILYMGDQDPSGIQIYESIIDQFNHFGRDATIKRIGVTPEQIRALGLPSMPQSAETMAKIQRDPRLRKYLARYGKIFCELDSFVSLQPDAFASLLKQEIDKHLDRKLAAKAKELEGKLREVIREAVQSKESVLKELRDVLTAAVEAGCEDIDFNIGTGDDDDDDSEGVECDYCENDMTRECDCGNYICDNCSIQCSNCGNYFCPDCYDAHAEQCSDEEPDEDTEGGD